MIDGFAAEGKAAKSEGMKMTVPKSGADRTLNEKILTDSATMTVTALCAKYNVPRWRVYDTRYRAKKAGRPPGAAVPELVENRGRRRGAASGKSLVRPVEIDPQRPGTAASLLAALDKRDDRETRIALGFTLDEIARLVDRMTPAQQTEFLAAGLRAALLA